MCIGGSLALVQNSCFTIEVPILDDKEILTIAVEYLLGFGIVLESSLLENELQSFYKCKDIRKMLILLHNQFVLTKELGLRFQLITIPIPPSSISRFGIDLELKSLEQRMNLQSIEDCLFDNELSELDTSQDTHDSSFNMTFQHIGHEFDSNKGLFETPVHRTYTRSISESFSNFHQDLRDMNDDVHK